MMLSKKNGQYDSYLLRIWRGDEKKQWRWMLQNVRTGEQKGFRDMDALVRFLSSVYSESQATLRDLSLPE